MLDDSKLLYALQELGRALADRGLSFQVAVVGGSALLLRKLRDRPTADVDVVASARRDEALRPRFTLPEPLRDAAADVALSLGLEDNWINAASAALIGDKLPEGYRSRMDSHVFDGLVVSVLGREDLVRLKLYAASDEGPGSWHVDDLRGMAVSDDELDRARAWVLQTTNQLPALVADVISVLRGR